MVTINKLSMKGFKSFANRTELLFGKKFGIIIGANGAGKTNVSDAICFVLGKSSAKDMRAEKSSNLIFNGGKKGSPAKEAEVTIEFDNSSKKFPIESREVKIGRIVRQNGTSIYKINNETRTRQQVIDLLNAAKIDPNGHNIILQGDIVSLAEMKPVERRQIIEEISGISVYEEKKQKCLNELQKVDSKLNETEIILTERAANLRELKKERDQAIRYKELQETIKSNKATLLHLNINEKQEKVNDVEKRKKEAEGKISSIDSSISSIKGSIQEFKNEINRITEDIETKGEKDQLLIRRAIEDIKTILVKSESRLDVCSSEIEKIKSRKHQLNSNLEEINKKISSLNNEKENHGKKIKSIAADEKELQKRIDDLKEKYGIDSNLNEKLEAIDSEIYRVIEEIGKTQEEKQEIIRSKDQILFRLNAVDDRLKSLKGSREDFEKLKQTKKGFKESENALNKLLAEKTLYFAQLDSLQKEFRLNSDELARLNARLVGIRETGSYDFAVNKVLEANIKGVHGRTASLGKVDSQFSLALEVAIGARANSIVVDTDATAQKCIEYLKKNKLGVVTFLPINKIKPRAEDKTVQEILSKKGVHGFADKILKYDSKYKNIFSYLLGSTIIADDIDTARRIGIGRARVVTLEGDLLEPSGAMIGGYRKKRQGLGFVEEGLDEKTKALEDGIKRLRLLINSTEKKREETEENIQKLREERANLEAEIIKLEKTLDLEGSSDLLDSKKELQEKLKEHESKITLVEKKIKLASENLESVKKEKSKLKEKASDPEKLKALEVLEDEKLKMREKAAEISAAIKNIEMQTATILAPEMDRTEKILKQHDKENEDFLSELNNLKEFIKSKNNELKEKESQEKKFYANFRDLINKRNKFNERMQKSETDIAREEERKKSHEQRLNNINIERAKFIAELEALNKEFEEFREAKISRGVSIEELKDRIKSGEKELNNIGNVNLRALEVYEQIEEEYKKITEKVDKLKNEKDDVLNMMAEIEGRKKEIFMKTYSIFAKNFKSIFDQLTKKGEAHIVLENNENPFEGGIEIQVRVAGNKFLDMRSLSGGEKTLAALAFIFAIQEHQPSPFYLLDEVDAALDKNNSQLLSKLIQKYSENAQYVVISHNDSIITEAENIYGVAMKEGVSKVVSLKV